MSYRKMSRREWAQALPRMTSVGAKIQQIVQYVDRGRRQGKGKDCDQNLKQCVRLGYPVRGEQRHEQKCIFRPLMNAKRGDVVEQPGFPVHEPMRHTRTALKSPLDATIGIDQHSTLRLGPDRHILAGVAGILER